MIIYILCLKHKRALNFIEIIDMFFDEQTAYLEKDKFNETRPSYSMATIITREVLK